MSRADLTLEPSTQADTSASQGWAPQAWILRLDHPIQGAAQGPLAGLRFTVKVGGLPTTAACPAFAYTPHSYRPPSSISTRCIRIHR